MRNIFLIILAIFTASVESSANNHTHINKIDIQRRPFVSPIFLAAGFYAFKKVHSLLEKHKKTCKN